MLSDFLIFMYIKEGNEQWVNGIKKSNFPKWIGMFIWTLVSAKAWLLDNCSAF